ncbi:MAG: hypothetical protein R2860_09145 [Desulfobacterales bacterium]
MMTTEGCLYTKLYRNLKRKKILLLTALLHDIGKGRGVPIPGWVQRSPHRC